ncbi:putative N-alpha-acetyltransferase 11 [Paratrimastix pyriformis]|uniref:N-alpha-acetyltransferase 11 n=1 Tax=Paratrimastix pyriformis TaxID=342808 RepID=A0ABQ8US57_9EUKA|nr:putative N-alpha-acetyltransferase 11 [Paratrimastix pyriformis]
MVNIRRATISDLMLMQHCNLNCLPENYNLRYYLYHGLLWPQLLHCAEIPGKGKIVGYVLAKMEDEDGDAPHGHITSISVMRTHRKLALASNLMHASERSMVENYGAQFCSLHVRETNTAAKHLYAQTLGFLKADQEKGYYADGENADYMKMPLSPPMFPHPHAEIQRRREEEQRRKAEEARRVKEAAEATRSEASKDEAGQAQEKPAKGDHAKVPKKKKH